MFDAADCVAEEVPVSFSVSRKTHPASANGQMRPGTHCSGCAMRPVCTPQGLTPAEVARLDAIICSTRLVRQGEALYRANAPFQSIYAVRAGSFKTVDMHRDGPEHVTGVHLAGDVLGWAGRHLFQPSRSGCDRH